MKTTKLTIRKIGNSLGLILSEEAVQLLNAKEGQVVIISKSPDEATITPYDPDFETRLEKARSIMDRYKNCLRQLAK
jgi:putative addiction module antidote